LFIPVTGKAAGDRKMNPLLHGQGVDETAQILVLAFETEQTRS
jgi:hypothetical protein